MSRDHTLDEQTRSLLRESAAFRMLARLFECPDADWRAELERLSRELADPELRAAVDAIDDTATPAQYYSVFGPGGPAPPREASYYQSLELGSLMSELSRFYDAFAYAPRSAEVPDHVSIEAGFVSYLKFKEAYARARGDDDGANVVSDAATRFMREHLSRLALPLATLLATSHLAYLHHASRLLAARVGAPPAVAFLPMLAAADDSEGGDLECGLG
jgi:nitrate reductase assembly molybdenum cofactor insertion protein NarJ